MESVYMNQIEIVVNLFTVEGGKLKVLLFKKQDDPFKGYWMLPSNLLMTNETIEECAEATILEFTGLTNIFTRQSDVFSRVNRLPGSRILANSLVSIVDIEKIKYDLEIKNHMEGVWFDIHEIPKMIYDHGDILQSAIHKLRQLLSSDYNTIKKLYPNDFTLPELQLTYEHIFNKKLDRRNFRKKLIQLNILEDTLDKNNQTNGRPAKLYCFKDNIQGDVIK